MRLLPALLALASLALACSKKIDGPVPSVTAVVSESNPTQNPPVICNRGGDPATGRVIDVLGSGFAPMPVGILGGAPTLAMPSVTLVGPETWTVPSDRVFFAGDSKLVVDLPTADTSVPYALTPGIYAVRVANPTGKSGELANALGIVSVCPELGRLGVYPRFGWTAKNQPVTISNDTSVSGLPFTFGRPTVAIVAPIVGSSTPQRIPVRRVSVIDAHTITGVVPDCSGLSATDASGTCAGGIAPGGPYDVEVQDASGAQGRIASAFTVLPNPPPSIGSINPTSITTTGLSGASFLTVSGSSFDSGAPAQRGTVELGFQVAGGVEFCPMPLHAGGIANDTRLDVDVVTTIVAGSCYVEAPDGTRSVPTQGLTLSQGLYLVRVEHAADPASADYSGLIVTSTSYNPVAGPPISTLLADPGLADFPLVQASDDVDGHYLYTLGGVLVSGATSHVGLAPLDRFGNVGGAPCLDAARSGSLCFRQFARAATDAQGQGRIGVGVSGGEQARSGMAAVVRHVPGDTDYVLVIGGADSAGHSLATVERAQVLRSTGAPVLDDSGTAASGGSLAQGSYTYRVAAVMPASDPVNPAGETLASDATAVAVGPNGTATISFACIPAGAPTAVKYKIYRTVNANDPAGTERLLDVVTAACSGSPPKQTYTDGGGLTPSGDGPLPAGALGKWVPLASLATARNQARAILVGDDLWVVGGGCTTGSTGCGAPGDLASVEHVAFNAGLATFNGVWGSSGTLNRARSRHALTAITHATAPNAVPTGATYLLAAGGVSGGTLINGTGNPVFEIATVSGGGTTWAAGNAPSQFTYSPAQSGQEGGWIEVQADNAFVEGAVPGATPSLFNRSTTGGICRAAHPCPVANSTDFDLGLNAGFPAYALGGHRYLVGETLFRAFIYTAGGWNSTAQATLTDTLERLVY